MTSKSSFFYFFEQFFIILSFKVFAAAFVYIDEIFVYPVRKKASI